MLFKIQNSEGLYSTGGYHPTFTKRGKKWQSKRAIKLHLAQHKKNISNLDWKVVVIDDDGNESNWVDVYDYYLNY